MKHARVVYKGTMHHAWENSGSVQLNDGRIVEEHDVEWLPPFVPNTAFTLGLNYEDHAKELSFDSPREPLVFLKGPNTFTGHRGEAYRPADVTFMHYECELAVVMGRTARHIDRKNAYKYVAGYTIANDYVIRDYLENYYRPNLYAKNRDALTPLGPWFVDAEDIEDPMDLQLRTYINGVLTQEGNTRDMMLGVPELIAYLSSFMTLNTGDIILTGTPKGSVDTKIGDEVVTQIEGIGSLASTVIGEESSSE